MARKKRHTRRGAAVAAAGKGEKAPRDAARDGEAAGTGWFERNERWCVLAVALVAAGLRATHLLSSRAGDPFFTLPGVDPRIFHEWGVAVASGDVLGEGVFFLSPLYPYFLGAVYAVFGEGFIVARVVQLVLGVLSVVLVHLIGRRLFGVRAGLLAATFQAFHQPAIFYENIFLVGALQAPLNLLFAWTLLRAMDRPIVPRFALSGILLGLSALARPNVLLLGGYVVPWIFVALRGESSLLRRVFLAAAFCIGIGAMVFPVTARNYLLGDDFVLVSSQGGVNLYIGNGPDANGAFVVPRIFAATRADDPHQQEEAYRLAAEKEVGRELKPSEVSDYWGDRAWEHISAHPGESLRLLGRKLILFFNYYEIGNSRDIYSSEDFSVVLRMPLPTFGLLAPLGLLGMVLAALRPRRRGFSLPYAMVVSYLLSLVIFFVLAHYRIPVVPFFAVFAGVAVDRMVGLARERRHGLLATGLVVLVAATAFSWTDVEQVKMGRFMVYYNLGNKFRKLGRSEEAEQQYRSAIEANPSYISSYNNLALVYEEDPKTHGKAIDVWQRVLLIARQRGDAMYVERAQRHIQGLYAAGQRPAGQR